MGKTAGITSVKPARPDCTIDHIPPSRILKKKSDFTHSDAIRVFNLLTLQSLFKSFVFCMTKWEVHKRTFIISQNTMVFFEEKHLCNCLNSKPN